jgi:hypothetical protein
MNRRIFHILITSMFCLSLSTAWAQSNACDLAAPSGTIDIADVNAAVNMAIGVTPCTANIAGPNVCNVAVVQRVVNALPAPSGIGSCITGTGSTQRTVDLRWTASSTPNVRYNIYRSTTSGGYTATPLKSLVTGTSDSDSTVASGTTYYYVTRAVDSNNNLSAPSNEISVFVP